MRWLWASAMVGLLSFQGPVHERRSMAVACRASALPEVRQVLRVVWVD